jgi:MFS transporter, MHS family, proline/betaine transporter
VLTWGMSVTQSKLVPAAYVTTAAVISVIGLLICICKFGDDKPTE